MDTDNDDESIQSRQQPSTSVSYTAQESQSSEFMSSYDMYGDDTDSDDELPDPSVLDKKLDQVSIFKIDVSLLKRKEINESDNFQVAKKMIKTILSTKECNKHSDSSSGPPKKFTKIYKLPSSATGEDSAVLDDTTVVREIRLKPKIKRLLKERHIQHELKLYQVKTKQDSSFTRLFSDFATQRSRKRIREENEVTKSYVLMFYRNIETESNPQTKSSTNYIPEIFALTTGIAWQQVKSYADKDFTKAIEKRTLKFTFQHVEKKYDSGPIMKLTKNARMGCEIVFDVWDFLGTIVGARTRKPRENSSLFSLNVSSRIHITEKSMKIHRKMNVIELGKILAHFSNICSKHKTYLVSEKKEEEVDDPRFQMLDLSAKVTDESLLGELNHSLYTVLKKCMNGDKFNIFLTHPSVEKWQTSDEFYLYARKPTDQMGQIVTQKRRKIKTWKEPPSLVEVMQELRDCCGTVFHPKWLDDVNIRFGSTTAPLKKFIFRRFSTTRIGTYIYHHGEWMEMKGEYLYFIETDFVEKMKEHFLNRKDLPLLPWEYPGKKVDNDYQVNKMSMAQSKERWGKHFESVCKTGQFVKVIDEAEKLLTGSKEIPFDIQNLKNNGSNEHIAANMYLLLKCNLNEDDYNAAHTLLNMLMPQDPEAQIITCDKKTPHGIELCDILISKEKTTYLVHVKEGFRGSSIREVCSQIRNAADNIFREQQISKGTGMINAYWDLLKLEIMKEEEFKQLFHPSRQIVFVLAYRDTRKENDFTEDARQSRNLHAKVTDAIRGKFTINQSSRIIAKLTKEEYLTNDGSLTDKFILEGKDIKTNFEEKLRTWNEIGSLKMAKDVFQTLASGLSRSKSTIAKMEVCKLVKDFERYWIGEKKFQLKIYSIDNDF